MPIKQPVQTIVHTNDFRDKAYCFEAESVLPSQERIGVMTVSASMGYLLATSSNKEFKREQIVEHVLQEDGSWMARAAITLLIAADSPVDGTVLIRNSAAETCALAIDVNSTPSLALAMLEQPTLTISESVLTFTQTSSDKPSFAVLTIAQQHSEEPVTLSTDAPDYFQLASDSRPAFSPTLTLIPSSTGTYVHVRYSANKPGFRSGELTIQNSTEKRTVLLEGRSSGLLPAIRTNPLLIRKAKSVRLSERPRPSKRWVSVLLFMVMSGLAYAGYATRCQFFPALCQAQEISQSKAQQVQVLPALNHGTIASEKIVARPVVTKRIKQKDVPSPTPVPKLLSSPNTSPVTTSEKQVIADADQERSVEADIPQLSSQQQPKKQSITKSFERQTVERITVPASTDESDLERALNQKPNPLN